jgi:trafficking protein particle complex subunit 12
LTLLDVPPPFRISSSQPSPDTPLSTLVSSGHFRSAAIKAAQFLISTPPNAPISPSDHATIFSLIYTRLSCLTLCNATPLAAQEVKALEDLNSSYYLDDLTSAHLVPWELRVLAVRLQGMGFNDARRGVMGYFDLARDARISLSNLKKDREGNEGEIKMWEHRLEDLGIRVASALVEMEDLDGAARFLQTLKPSSPAHWQLEMKKALLWLCMGDVDAARSCLRDDDEREKNMILALAYMADNEFENAVKLWNDMLSSPRSEDDAGERAMWRQNLGVCLLYLGRMDEVFIPLSSHPTNFRPSLFLVNFPLLTRIAP